MSSTPFVHDDTTSKLLPALQHAASGSLGTLISTCALYPLSLVTTRLQVQKQLLREGGRLAAATASREAGAGAGTGAPSATAPSTTRGGRIDPSSGAYAASATAAATASAIASAAAGVAASRHPRFPHPDSKNLKGTTPFDYDGIGDAFSKIYASEGGLRAFYTGLGSDTAKSLLDSFLFFMFYEWFRSIRLAVRHRRGKGLGALEELAIGVAAGACSRALTTPIANVATRKQTASTLAGVGVGGGRNVGDIARGIKSEKAAKGLWAGFSASLILTLNPSITFFLQGFLKKHALSKERAENPGTFMTFLLAASSKAIASAVTFPFQTAQTRLQSGIGADADEEEDLIMLEDRDIDKEVESKLHAARARRRAARRSIFGTVIHIARSEGVGSLYDGVQGEMLKGFLSHGTTMVAKDAIHKMLFRLYFVLAGMLSETRLRKLGRLGRRGKSSKQVEIVVPVERAIPMMETAKPPKKRPQPLDLHKAIEPIRSMEPHQPTPTPQRSAFEHRPSSFEHATPTPRRSTFEPTAMTQRPSFEPRPNFHHTPRPAFEPRHMVPDEGGIDRGVVLSPLPPALQYRMDIPDVGGRRIPPTPKSPVIMNMLDKSHRELD